MRIRETQRMQKRERGQDRRYRRPPGGEALSQAGGHENDNTNHNE